MKEHFPQYRRLSNGKSYYAIHSHIEMEEWQSFNGRWLHYSIKATILPERTLIADVLDGLNGAYQSLNESEWEAWKATCNP
jgi:hypothetical protein